MLCLYQRELALVVYDGYVVILPSEKGSIGRTIINVTGDKVEELFQ